jgi:hypothetical protein
MLVVTTSGHSDSHPNSNAFEVALSTGINFSQQAPPPPQAVGPFCFPLGKREAELTLEQRLRLKHTFSLMDSNMRTLHGFCRRASPPAVPQDSSDGQHKSHSSQPCVLCILAPVPFFHVFFRCLEIIHHLLNAEGLLRSQAEPDDNAMQLPTDLPMESNAMTFLTALRASLSDKLTPGRILRLPLPRRSDYRLSALPTISIDIPASGVPQIPPTLAFGDDFAEIQVPPCGAGTLTDPVVPLASMVYKLSPAVLATLLASLLMERRIILLSSSFATIATAVHACSELIRPFRWHHLVLPLLPASLLGVLCSPSPYLVGLPAALQDEVDWASIDEAVVVNIDKSSIEPAIGTEQSDSSLLPGWQQLVAAFATMQDNLHSPHDYRANGTVSAVVQEFLAATIGGYRDFVKSSAQQQPSQPVTAASRLQGGLSRLRVKLSETFQDASDSDTAGAPKQAAPEPEPEKSGYMDDCIIQGSNGYRFYHSAFVASFGNKASRHFAASLIHTQMWQVFVCDRMAMMQQAHVADDPFEVRVLQRQARNKSIGTVLTEAVQRVKDTPRATALARWTEQKAGAVMSFGKVAAGAMSAGIDRAWAQIEQSPESSLDNKRPGGTNRTPMEFFDKIDEPVRQDEVDLQPLRQRYGVASRPERGGAGSDAAPSEAGSLKGTAPGKAVYPVQPQLSAEEAARERATQAVMADLVDASSSEEDIFGETDDRQPRRLERNRQGRKDEPGEVGLAARAALALLRGKDLAGDVQGARAADATEGPQPSLAEASPEPLIDPPKDNLADPPQDPLTDLDAVHAGDRQVGSSTGGEALAVPSPSGEPSGDAADLVAPQLQQQPSSGPRVIEGFRAEGFRVSTNQAADQLQDEEAVLGMHTQNRKLPSPVM